MSIFSGVFGPSKSTRTAAAGLEKDVEASRGAAQSANAAYQNYYGTFGSRNKGIIGMQRRALERAKGWETGRDVGKNMAGLATMVQGIADTNRKVMEMTGGMGTNALAQSNPNYMRKLMASTLRKSNRESGYQLAALANQQYQQDINTGMQTSQFLNADRQAGLGFLGQGVGNMLNVAGAQSNLYQARQQMDAQKLAGFMGMANLGIGALTGVGGIMSAMKPSSVFNITGLAAPK